MKLLQPTKRLTAFTLIELLCVILIIAVFVGLFFPIRSPHRIKSATVLCLNNLKMNGVILTAYSDDHNGLMPWQEFTDATDANSAHKVSIPALPAWQYMATCSNYYGTSNRYLLCPREIERPGSQPEWPPNRNKSISYFINLYGTNNQDSPLMGDRNLSPGNDQPFYSSGINQPVYVNPNNTVWRTFSSNEFHQDRGNLLFHDGHVETLETKELRSILSQNQNSNGSNANRFLFPQ